MLQFLKIMFDGKKAQTDERGATAVEYGLLVALISAIIIVSVVTIGKEVSEGFKTVADKLTAA